MNKYIVKAMLFGAVALGGLTSCELDQYPETSLPTDQTWQKLSDAANYNIGLKSAVRLICGGIYAEKPDLQSDLFNMTTANSTSSINQLQDWSFESASGMGDGLWANCYGVISNANNIINNIDKINVEEGSQDEVDRNYYKGAAYFARALAYDKLARRFCKAYDKATADQTLGLPLVTSIDVNYKPSRSSLKATYDLIKEDIKQAKLLMGENDVHNADNSLISYNTADALDARISLNCQDYDNAIACAQRTISKYALCSTAEDFANMWKNDEGSEIIFQPIQTKDERTNSYDAYISFSTANNGYSPDYIPTQGLIDLYEANDMRQYTYFAATGAVTNDITDENVIIFNKYPGNPALVKTSAQTEFYNMTKELRVGEMYLIAAEASYMKDGSGLSFLNDLRSKRGATALLNLSGAQLFSQIKDEWARETCGEGFRLDCLKRWGDGCRRMAAQHLTDGFLRNDPNYLDLNVPATDKHFVWELPQNDTQANTNLQKNWE